MAQGKYYLSMLSLGTRESQRMRPLISIGWAQMYLHGGWAWVDISPSKLSNEQFPQIQRKISLKVKEKWQVASYYHWCNCLGCCFYKTQFFSKKIIVKAIWLKVKSYWKIQSNWQLALKIPPTTFISIVLLVAFNSCSHTPKLDVNFYFPKTKWEALNSICFNFFFN